MEPRPLLRSEGPVLLFLAPDLSMAGYLVDERVGSYAYNAGHTYLPPALLLGAGLWWSLSLAVSLALIWFAHIGIDRALAYGLKYETGFKDTHFGRVAREK